MSFWTAVVVIVAILAFAGIRTARYRALGRGAEGDHLPHRLAEPRAAELERDVAELKKRLAVLERIATDDRHGRAIAHEIEQLRDR